MDYAADAVLIVSYDDESGGMDVRHLLPVAHTQSEDEIRRIQQNNILVQTMKQGVSNQR